MQRRRHQASGSGWDKRFGLAWCRWLPERMDRIMGPHLSGQNDQRSVGRVCRSVPDLYGSEGEREGKRKRRRRYTYPRQGASRMDGEWERRRTDSLPCAIRCHRPETPMRMGLDWLCRLSSHVQHIHAPPSLRCDPCSRLQLPFSSAGTNVSVDTT